MPKLPCERSGRVLKMWSPISLAPCATSCKAQPRVIPAPWASDQCRPEPEERPELRGPFPLKTFDLVGTTAGFRLCLPDHRLDCHPPLPVPSGCWSAWVSLILALPAGLCLLTAPLTGGLLQDPNYSSGLRSKGSGAVLEYLAKALRSGMVNCPPIQIASPRSRSRASVLFV